MKILSKRRIGWICVIFLAVIVLMIDIGFYADSVVSPYLIILIPVALGAVSGVVMWRLWRYLSGSEKFLPNFLIHTAISAVIFAFMILGVNRALADKESVHTEKVVAERVYYQTRKRNKRVGRRYLPTGEEYKVYYMDVRFDNGKEKKMPLTLSEYNRTRKGDTLEFRMEKGFFGIPVIMSDKVDPVRKNRRTIRRNPAIRH